MLKLGFCRFTISFGFSFPLPDEMPPIRDTNSERKWLYGVQYCG